MTSALSPVLQGMPSIHPLIALVGMTSVASCLIIFRYTHNKFAQAMWMTAMVFMVFFTLDTIFG